MQVNPFIWKIDRYIKDRDYRFLVNASKFRYFPEMDDEVYLKRKFKAIMGKELDLNTPRSFNEKLQWIKLHDRNPEYTVMVDKYEAKSWVAAVIGEEHIIPTFGVWDSVRDIDFDSLPSRFILKCTHDSHGLVLCRDKKRLDIKRAQKILSRGMRRNYYYFGREWPYKDVKPRIIAEEYLEGDHGEDLRDYKFLCFNGKCRLFKIDFDRFGNHRSNFYDVDGSLLPFGLVSYPPDPEKKHEIPAGIDEMIRLAEKLAGSIPFVRVDLYYTGGRIYFGEMTFFPSSGFGLFEPQEWDLTMGAWLDLPDIGDLFNGTDK